MAFGDLVPTAPQNINKSDAFVTALNTYLLALGKGTAGSPSTGVTTVQGITNGTPVIITNNTLAAIIAAAGSPTATAATVQTPQPIQFSVEVIHETGKTMAANDVIGPLTVPLDAVTGTIVLRAGQPFRITQLHLKIDSLVATVLAAQMRVHFFNDAATVTPIAGNSQNTLLYANGLKRIGVADFYGFKTAGTGSTGSFAIGQFQNGYASFLDGIPVAQQLSFRIENITAGTVLATGQKLTLMGMVQPL